MSLFNVDFSESDDNDVDLFKNTVPFKPKFNVPDEKAKPKYLQEQPHQNRTRRQKQDITKVEKKVVEVQPQVLENPPPQQQNRRRTRKKEIITMHDVDSSDEPQENVNPPEEEETKQNSDSQPQELEIKRSKTPKPEQQKAERTRSPKGQNKFVKIDSSSSENATDEPTDPVIKKEPKAKEEPKPQSEKKTENKAEQPHKDQPTGNFSKFAIPVEVKSKEQPMYRISREKKTSLLGMSYTFLLYQTTDHILSATYKKGAEVATIYKGQIPADKNANGDAYVSVGNKTSDFALRLESKTGEEVLSIRFYPKEPKEAARRLTLSFFAPKEEAPSRLYSRQPTETNNGTIDFDFKGRFHITSVKNAVLFEKKSDPDLFWIRKIDRDVIELQAGFPIDPLCMFAIGLASFITEVK